MVSALLNVGGAVPRGLMTCGGLIVVCLVLFFWLRRSLRDVLLRGMPRLQHTRFVFLLRSDTFADPLRVLGTLSGDDGSAYLHRLWAQAKHDTVRAAAELARAEGANAERLKPMTDAESPSQPLAAEPVPAPGWALVVVTLPQPQRNGETYFAAAAVPSSMLGGDPAQARAAVRFFVLNKWALGRDTDLVEHTAGGRTLTYNVGTGKSVAAFADAVSEKLQSPLPAWATPPRPRDVRQHHH